MRVQLVVRKKGNVDGKGSLPFWTNAVGRTKICLEGPPVEGRELNAGLRFKEKEKTEPKSSPILIPSPPSLDHARRRNAEKEESLCTPPGGMSQRDMSYCIKHRILSLFSARLISTRKHFAEQAILT